MQVRLLKSISSAEPLEGLTEVALVVLHLLEHDADQLDQAGFGSVLIDLVRACDVDVVERAHHLQQASLVDLSRVGRYNGQQSSHNLELDLLVSLGRAFAHFVYDGIDQLTRKHPVALRTIVIWVYRVIWMIAIHEAMRDQYD